MREIWFGPQARPCICTIEASATLTSQLRRFRFAVHRNSHTICAFPLSSGSLVGRFWRAPILEFVFSLISGWTRRLFSSTLVPPIPPPRTFQTLLFPPIRRPALLRRNAARQPQACLATLAGRPSRGSTFDTLSPNTRRPRRYPVLLSSRSSARALALRRRTTRSRVSSEYKVVVGNSCYFAASTAVPTRRFYSFFPFPFFLFSLVASIGLVLPLEDYAESSSRRLGRRESQPGET